MYQRTREALADALGVDPSPELSALHVALLRGELGRREENRKTNLRAELTSFVGKDADVAAVRELVAEHRLTTLIGPGGSGKTRLATETARTLLGDLPDGAWLVELAAIGADGDVAQATLAGLGLRDALLGGAPSAEPTDRLIAAIREREALLILDNCEHVIESAAAFADRLLGECRRLRILATSREPLGITGEALWLVEPLALPDEDAGPGEIESSPAVRLLRDRAGAVRKDLGGRRRTRLSTMARDLPGAGRDAAGDRAGRGQVAHHVHRSARQPARRPVPPADRRQPHRVAAAQDAARGGRLELGAAHRRRTDGPAPALGVLGRGEPGSGRAGLRRRRRSSRSEVLELLTSLAEKSLLLTEGDGAPRYRMLGTIKEYAAAPARRGGGIGPGAPGASRLLHRARRDRRAAPAPRRAAGLAGHARGRARQHRCRDARGDRGRRGAGGDAARGGRRLVLVARRAPGRRHRADASRPPTCPAR